MDQWKSLKSMCLSAPQAKFAQKMVVKKSARPCAEEVVARGLKGRIRINKAGCFDQCGNGPMVVVYPESTWYAHVRPTDADQLVDT